MSTFKKILSLLIFIGIFAPTSHAEEIFSDDGHLLTPFSDKKNFLKSIFSDKEKNFFPVPIFETNPEEGQNYGIMPVLTFSDKNTKAIDTIVGAMGQWNKTTKFSGAGIFIHYPHANTNPEEFFQIYFEWAQRFYREGEIKYFNPKFLKTFYLDTRFQWLHTPFRRFFGYGANTQSASESNYESHNFYFKTTFGYLLPFHLRISLSEEFTHTEIKPRAITDVADTLTLFAGTNGIIDSSTLLHRLSLTFDTRPTGTTSRHGTFAEVSFFTSIEGIISDQTVNGYTLEATHLQPWLNEKMVTAARFFLQDMYGTNIPFYIQSRLGGDTQLRSFVAGRFTDTGKIYAAVEQRIRVFHHAFFGIPCELWADPFVEVGRVFNHINNIDSQNWQPVGGLGIRLIVPPNVVARIDTSIGKEGYQIYTLLGYPF